VGLGLVWVLFDYKSMEGANPRNSTPSSHRCCFSLCKQYVDDWEKPCLISAEEEALFRELLPNQVEGRPGALCAAPHTAQVRRGVDGTGGADGPTQPLNAFVTQTEHINPAPQREQELDAARPAALVDINRELDRQMASYGIHPGRQGLSDLEFLAAMKLLE